MEHFLRCRIDDGARARLAEFHGVDWESVHAAGRAEGLEPLLYSIVRKQEIVPPELENTLRLAYRRNRIRNTLLMTELADVLAKLAKAGVPAILLKGAALIKTVYRDAALRPMLDLDLLISRGHIDRAIETLQASGYRAAHPETKPGNTVTFENEWQLRKQEPFDLLIEPHWSLFDSPYYQYLLPMDWFWRTAVPVEVDSTGAHALGPEAQVIHLCGHTVLHHRGTRVLWLHDIAEVISHYRDRIDWELVIARALEFDLVLPMKEVLPRLADGWAAPIPPGVLTRVRNLTASRSEERVSEHLAAGQPAGRRFWFDLSTLPTSRMRFQFAWNNLFPSPAYMRERYRITHRMLLPLYYLWRWLVGLWTAR